ncbi:DciA family protein [Streptomyces sp. NPDC006539]|uniref:DciA family protein n=1 Tax=unclassified Streptomyces TaxID=2593676 RepID=UPI0033A2C6FA
MTIQDQPSGVDLARQALFAAREAATKKGAARTEKPRGRTRVVYRNGRDPLALGEAITAMMTECALSAPAAGGRVLAEWDNIVAAAVPKLANHTQAVKFDAETGRLDVAPEAPAFGTKLRWSAPLLIAQANRMVKGAAVRTIHVLSPAPRTAVAAAQAADLARAPVAEAPPRTRQTASAGCRRALEAHQAGRTRTAVDPAAQSTAEGPTTGSRMREPEHLFREGRAAMEELRAREEAERSASMEATHAQALRQLAAERAGRVPRDAPKRTA